MAEAAVLPMSFAAVAVVASSKETPVAATAPHALLGLTAPTSDACRTERPAVPVAPIARTPDLAAVTTADVPRSKAQSAARDLDTASCLTDA